MLSRTLLFSLALPLLFVSSLPLFAAAEESVVPAYTAYLQPDFNAAQFSEDKGVTRWRDAKQTLNWYGLFRNSGKINIRVVIHRESGSASEWLLKVGSQEKTIKAAEIAQSQDVTLDFGSFEIQQVGYQRFELRALDDAALSETRIVELRLEGPATKDVHFNLKPRRNAASVHMVYQVPSSISVSTMYCEVTAVEDPTSSFYMSCGWHRGYLGMQVISPTERRIIFSVWDSGDEQVDRDKVKQENRTRLIAKGEKVIAHDFGNEGTGGHSHLKVMWKTGTTQRFAVTAKPTNESHTIYAGYWYDPEKNEWMLISAWDAPKDGQWLKGLHSFSEDFSGSNGYMHRKALYGNQWIKTKENEWLELNATKFSHDPTGREDRFDRSMGVENGQFFLSHGGFQDTPTRYGQKFMRPATGKQPELKLPNF